MIIIIVGEKWSFEFNVNHISKVDKDKRFLLFSFYLNLLINQEKNNESWSMNL